MNQFNNLFSKSVYISVWINCIKSFLQCFFNFLGVFFQLSHLLSFSVLESKQQTQLLHFYVFSSTDLKSHSSLSSIITTCQSTCSSSPFFSASFENIHWIEFFRVKLNSRKLNWIQLFWIKESLNGHLHSTFQQVTPMQNMTKFWGIKMEKQYIDNKITFEHILFYSSKISLCCNSLSAGAIFTEIKEKMIKSWWRIFEVIGFHSLEEKFGLNLRCKRNEFFSCKIPFSLSRKTMNTIQFEGELWYQPYSSILNTISSLILDGNVKIQKFLKTNALKNLW